MRYSLLIWLIRKKHKKILRRTRKRNRNRSRKLFVDFTKDDRRLADYEYLNPYMDTVLEEYKAEDLSLYRWAHNPLVKDDFLQQIYQESNPDSPETLKAPDLDASKEVILDYIDNFTYSNYLTVEDAVKLWRDNLQHRLSKVRANKKEKEIQKFIRKKGQYIIKVDYNKDVAIVGIQNNEVHKLTLLYDGVKFEDLIDKSFTPIKIDL